MKKMLFVLAFFGGAQSGGAQPTDTPKVVADSFYAAVRAARWERAAQFLEMEAFAKLLQARVRAARSWLPPAPMTVESLMANDSTLPRAVAEWQVKKFRPSAQARPPQDYSDEFAGVTSFPALQALTPLEGAARWIEANDADASWRRAVNDPNCQQPLPDSVRSKAPYSPYVLAAVEVNDSTAYALVWGTGFLFESFDEDHMRPAMIALRRRADSWRVIPSSWRSSDHGTSVILRTCR